LRSRLHPPAPHARPRPPAVQGRPRHVGKRRRRLLPLQLSQGGAHAATGIDAAARGAVSPELDRAPDPVQPQHPGRPDGLPEKPSAEATATAPLRTPETGKAPTAAAPMAERQPPAPRNFATLGT